MDSRKDGLFFIDEEGEKVIFNHYSFCEILKWIIVEYANKSFEEASQIVEKSGWINAPTSYLSVALTTHEYDYHWAMLLAYGDQYWNKGLAPYPPDDSFFDWYEQMIVKHNLQFPYTYIDAENK